MAEKSRNCYTNIDALKEMSPLHEILIKYLFLSLMLKIRTHEYITMRKDKEGRSEDSAHSGKGVGRALAHSMF